MFVIKKLISLRNSMVTQVVDWFRKGPKVWLAVCFVSGVVGLVCLALSTSFICLIGKWIWWKVLLYTMFSLLVILVAGFWLTKLSPSDSPILVSTPSSKCRTVSTVSVLLVILVYTHFVEEKVDVKPDAYIFVSYAAFSIMSLELSTLSHYGFEVELFYFFTGILTLQFMKIKWWLVIVGGGIMFILEYLRSTLDASLTSESRVHQDQNHVPKSQVPSIRNDDKVGLPTADASSSSQGVQENEVSSGDFLAELSSCIEALKEENVRVADKVYQYVNSSNLVDKNLVVNSMQLQLEDLHKCAQLMIKEGLEEKCLEEYISWRREFLNIILSLLRSPPDIKMEDIEMEDNEIEKNIQGWLETFTVAMRVLIPNEMTLCLHVFRYTNLCDSVFTDVCEELVTRLIVSSYAVATWSHFIPDTTLQQLLQELDTMFRLFPGKLSSVITNQVYHVRIALGILKHLKSDLANHDSDEVTADGVHSITRKVMKYIADEFRNNGSGLLEGCFEEYFTAAKERKLSSSPLVEGVIKILENSLEAISKRFRTPSLGYVFVMINRTFIAREMNELELEPIIGANWLNGNQDKIKQNRQLYLSSTWDEILSFLDKGFYEADSVYHLRDLMKEDLDSFKILFDGICNDNSMWLVFDDNLRNHIIESIKVILLPVYKEFITKYNNSLPIYFTGTIKPTPNDVEDGLNNLFRERAGESDDAQKEEKKNV